MKTAVAFNGVSLLRRTQEEYAYDLKRTIFALVEGRFRAPTRRLVLSDISFGIERGAKIGLIGLNGSGKSTTLKLMAGILRPTAGSVHVSGSVAPLIELGAGFDPELSVVDNIIYYGVMLGFPRVHMRRRTNAILEFAELFDHASEPLKTLSSGMLARLGFAVVTDSRPDLLLLDEVFSVGDEAFRRRSIERVIGYWDESTTSVVVSHETGIIRRLCDRVILLEGGRVLADGPTDNVVGRYDALIKERQEHSFPVADLDASEIALASGRLFRGDGTTKELQAIYLIEHGRKRWIRESAWLAANGYEYPRDVTFVHGDALEGVETGEPI